MLAAADIVTADDLALTIQLLLDEQNRLDRDAEPARWVSLQKMLVRLRSKHKRALGRQAGVVAS